MPVVRDQVMAAMPCGKVTPYVRLSRILLQSNSN